VYADNVALPAFGRTHAVAINRCPLLAWPIAANPQHAAAAGEWDRQTDGRTDGHCADL